MYILSAAQSRELDHAAIHERGIAGARLMSRAGVAVAQAVERAYPQALAGRIGVLCGGGNNGGDGMVAARWLRQRQVQVQTFIFAPADKLRGDAAGAFAQLRGDTKDGAEPIFLADGDSWAAQRPELLGCDLLIDALFGTGLVRPVRSWLAAVIAEINRDYRGPVLAVDVPSGLGADGEGPAELPAAPVLRARRTITFTTPKLGHFLSVHAACVGKLEIVPIGLPEDLLTTSGCGIRLAGPDLCRPYLAPRPRDSHKGLYGHVLVVAGSLGKSGAAVLASTAALRMGSGLVTAAVPRSVLPIVAAAHAELMTEPLPETPEGRFSLAGLEPAARAALLDPLLHGVTVMALGPGLTQSPESSESVRHLLVSAPVPCVLDADGLNAFVGRREQLRFPAGGVLTPHPGEMARLFGVDTAAVQARRLYYVQRLAAETGATALLKGQFTLTADPDGAVYVNPSGNPGMATAGSGDVLTGMIAGLIAQFPKRPLLETAAAAVYIHGRAGDSARAQLGELPLLAGDITAALPRVLAELQAPC